MSQNVKTYLGAGFYVLIFGFAYLVLKIALQYEQPLILIGHRYAISFLFIFVLRKLNLVKFQLTWSEFKKLAPIAVFYPLGFSSLQAYALLFVSSSEAGIIQALSPIFTMAIGSLLLGEKSSFMQKVFMLLSVFGVIYIFYNKGVSLHDNLGIGLLLMVFSVVCFSMSHILIRRVSKGFEPMKITYVMIAIAAVVFNTFALGDMWIKGSLHEYFIAFSSFEYIRSVSFLGVFGSVIASVLTNYVLSKIDAFKNSVFINLGTLLTIINGILFLHEEFNTYHLIGSMIIITGVIGVNVRPKHLKA